MLVATVGIYSSHRHKRPAMKTSMVGRGDLRSTSRIIRKRVFRADPKAKQRLSEQLP